MTDTKVCFKCLINKPLSEYYAHKGMGDGRLGKCKDCTRKDTKLRSDKLSDDPNWIEGERTRGRNKYRRLYVGLSKAKGECNKRWADKFPEKIAAGSYSANLKKPFPNAEKHHWSYNEQHYKDVIWLTKKEHMKGHRFLAYDQERMMYRRYDTNELLDTKERHEIFIKDCIQNKED